MSFAIISPTRVEVDGKDAGLLYDYIIANPGKAAEIKAALVAWHAGHVIAQQARDAEVLASKQEHQARADRAVADFLAKEEVLTAQLDALGGPERAAQKQREAILAQRAELDAKLAAIDGEPQPADVRG